MRLRDHLILGTDGGAVGDFFGYADHLELELFVRLSMTPAEAIRAATTRAARALGAALFRRLLSPSFIRGYTPRCSLFGALWPGTAFGQRLHPLLSGSRSA